MIEAPLIFRVARWPIETVDRLQSPEFTARVDHWLDEDAAIQAEGECLAAALHPLVPLITDRSARASVLALRRALHRDTAPLLHECLPATATLAPQLEAHAARRRDHAAELCTLYSLYDTALDTERAGLMRLVNEPEFQKALCLASPAAFEELRSHGSAPSWRLIRTLLQFVFRAAGRATPNGLWAGVAIEDGIAARAVEACPAPLAVTFQPRLAYFARALEPRPFAVLYESAWDALQQIPPLLSASEAPLWTETIETLRSLCHYLSVRFDSLSPEQLHAGLRRARTVLNRLLEACHQSPATVDESVLVADCCAPFRFRVATEFKSQVAAALRAAWNFDRLGTGESDARHRRQTEFAKPSTQPDIEAPWHRELSGTFNQPVHPLHSPAASQPMPFGSALLRCEFHKDGQFCFRVGSITPDPALFYARLHHLFSTVHPTQAAAFHHWYARALDHVEARHPQLAFADLALQHPSDWNAAARPRFRSRCLHPLEDLAGARIAAGPDLRPRLHLGAHRDCVVPLVSSAVSLHTSDPCTRKLAAVQHLLGRPSLLCPLPPLPLEREQWLHLPRLVLDGNIVIGVERWTVPTAVTTQLASSHGFDRFLLWRRFVRDARLPPLVYSLTALENTEALLPCSSLLALECLGRGIRGKATALRVQEALPDSRDSWLTGEQGEHYLVEIAAAWQGDDKFWAAYSAPPAQTLE